MTERFRVGWSNSYGWLVLEEVEGGGPIVLARTGKDPGGGHAVNYDHAIRIVAALNKTEGEER